MIFSKSVEILLYHFFWLLEYYIFSVEIPVSTEKQRGRGKTIYHSEANTVYSLE